MPVLWANSSNIRKEQGGGLFAAKESILRASFGGTCSKYLPVPMIEISHVPLTLVCYWVWGNQYLSLSFCEGTLLQHGWGKPFHNVSWDFFLESFQGPCLTGSVPNQLSLEKYWEIQIASATDLFFFPLQCFVLSWIKLFKYSANFTQCLIALHYLFLQEKGYECIFAIIIHSLCYSSKITKELHCGDVSRLEFKG